MANKKRKAEREAERAGRKAQVWIETVIYTLIGLALISLFLAFLLPKLRQNTDRIIIEQAIDDMNDLDGKIRSSISAQGNTRLKEFRIKQGQLVFDCDDDIIYFEIEDSRKEYSEPGSIVPIGDLNVLTTAKAEFYDVKVWLNYSSYLNINYNGQEEEKSLQKAPTPYRISVENMGFDNIRKLTNIKISEVS